MSQMDSFESMRALADLWGRGGNAFVRAAARSDRRRDAAEDLGPKGWLSSTDPMDEALKWRGELVFLSEALIGEPVGLAESETNGQ